MKTKVTTFIIFLLYSISLMANNQIPSFRANCWMEDSYQEIKDLKIQQIPMVGSHNAMYSKQGSGDMFHVQYNSLKDQFAWGGARYFDFRVYIEEDGSQYRFKSFHNVTWGPEHENILTELQQLNHILNENPNEIIILHLKSLYFDGGNPSNMINSLFTKINQIFGSKIIKPSELNSAFFDCTYSELLSEGNILFISEYDSNFDIHFRNYRDEDNMGKYISYPYVATRDEEKMAQQFDSKLAKNATNKAPFVVGASTQWSFNLKSKAIDFNKWFSNNRIDQWLNQGYSWIHTMDYVGWDQGWSRIIAKKLYQSLFNRAKYVSKKIINKIPKIISQKCKIFPNPIPDDQFTIQFKAIEREQTKVNIYDRGSNLVFTQKIEVYEGVNNIRVYVSNLKSKNYIVNIQLSDQLVVGKFMKRNL